MKRKYVVAVLAAMMLTMLTISFAQAATPLMGRMARMADTLAGRVDMTQYILYYQGVEVLRWNEGDAVPLIPAGDYRVFCQKGERARWAIFFQGDLEFTAVEGGSLDLAIPLDMLREIMVSFTVNAASLPNLNGQTGAGITIIYEDGTTAWGNGNLNGNGDLAVEIWLDPNKKPKAMVFAIGSHTYTSNISLDVISLIKGATVSINYDPVFKSGANVIKTFYAHRFWIFDGFEDTVDSPWQWSTYRVTLEAGKTYKFFTSSPLSNVSEIGDTMIGIWPGNFSGVLSFDGALVSNDDYSNGSYYSRVYFTPTSAGEYLLAVSGVSGKTGGYRVQVINANTTVVTGEITRCAESNCTIRPNNNTGLQISWSIASTNDGSGWFYGSGDGVIKVAVANVGSVSQIKDASAYQYNNWSVGPVGMNGIVLIHNTGSGHYGALKIRNIYDDNPNEPPYGYLDATWYDQTNGTEDFSQ